MHHFQGSVDELVPEGGKEKMCNWCEKETVGEPMICGSSLPMICEHCGGRLPEGLSYKNLKEWAIHYVESLHGKERRH